MNKVINNARLALENSRQNNELLPPEVGCLYDGNLAEKFREETERVNGSCFIVENAELLPNRISDYLRKKKINSVAIYDNKVISSDKLSAELAKSNPLMKIISGKPGRNTALEVETGLTGTYKLIAETGSVVVISDTPGGRFGSLLPPHHIVVATEAQLLPSFHSLGKDKEFVNTKWSVLISGPSRTADIEQTLILGVHGPLSLAVFIISG